MGNMIVQFLVFKLDIMLGNVGKNTASWRNKSSVTCLPGENPKQLVPSATE